MVRLIGDFEEDKEEEKEDKWVEKEYDPIVKSNLLPTIDERVNDILSYFDELSIRLNKSKNDDFKPLTEPYKVFKNNVLRILTADGKTSLKARKTKIGWGEVINHYDFNNEKYTKQRVDFYINQNQFGWQRLNTEKRLKLNGFSEMGFLNFMGRYRKEICDNLSNHYEKSDKAKIMCDLIREYNFHNEPPKLTTIHEHDISDKDINMMASFNNFKNTKPSSKRHKRVPITRIKFKTKDQIYGSNMSRLIIYYMDTNDSSDEKDSYVEKPFEYKLGRKYDNKEILKHIDCIDEIKKCVEKCLVKRYKKQDMFYDFINEFQEKFKTDLIALEL